MHLNKYLQELYSHRYQVAVIGFFLALSFFVFNFCSHHFILTLAQEDSLYEWGTALLYFITFVLLIISYRSNRNIYLLLLALVMLFGAFEEISWGQRIFNFQTPEKINALNVQGEFTVHNLKYFSHKQFKNQEGVEVNERWFRIDTALKVFYKLFGIVLPLCVFHLKPVQKLATSFRFPVPTIAIGIGFLLSWINLKYSFNNIPAHLSDELKSRLDWAVTEMAEFNGALVLMFIAHYFYKNRHQPIIGKDYKQVFLS